MSDSNRFDPTQTCICGTDLERGVWCAHWASPTSSVAVAYSCSELCSDLIERARTPEGQRLTRAMVTAVRNAVIRQGAKWN